MTVEHRPERNRFIITLAPDAEAYISYERLADGTLDLQHTVVPRAWLPASAPASAQRSSPRT